VLENLVCPKCKKAFSEEGGLLYCERCKVECVFDNGIYQLMVGEDYYWGEMSPDEMQKTLENTRSKGWRSAARDIGLRYRDMDEYISSSGRVDWLFHCLNLNRTESCLDIGSGWGTNAFALSKYYNEVWSLESVKQRLDFQRARREQDKDDNVKLVRADWLCLPFADNYFDLVVSSGVLEWVGLSDFSRNPEEVQLDFLREIRRVLKPGGCLYVGIENRYSAHMFLGGKDHSGLPFTSIMPRKLADVAVRFLRRTNREYRREKRAKEEWNSYRTYTYSQWGYRKMLKEAGFDESDFYWTLSYPSPRYGGRFDGESPAFLLRLLGESPVNPGFLASLVISIGSRLPRQAVKMLLPPFCPAFLIYAYKEFKEPSFESKLIESDRRTTSFLRVSGSLSTESKVNYFLLNNGRPFSIVKFPRFRQAAALVQEEEMRFGRFNQLEVGRESIGPMTVFREPLINGRQCRPLSLSHNRMALDWLLHFQDSTQKGFWEFEQLREQITASEHCLAQVHLDDGIRSRTKQRLALLLESLSKVNIPKNSEHGDFFAGNVLISDDGKTYVIDWEFYREDGEPLFDFVFFILNNAIARGPVFSSLRDSFCGRGKYAPILKDVVPRFARARGIPSEVVVQAVPYAILRCLHRTSVDEDRRHMDFYTYTHLLEAWDRLCLSNTFNALG